MNKEEFKKTKAQNSNKKRVQVLREHVIKIPEAQRRRQAKKHLFGVKQAGEGAEPCWHRIRCQMMPIPSA